MKRWHEDFYVSKRECNKRKYHIGEAKDIGRFRKKDAHDCGSSKCFLCHGDKFPKRELTEQEILSNISFKEQLNDQKF